MGLFDRFKKTPTGTTELPAEDSAPIAPGEMSDATAVSEPAKPKSLLAKFRDGLRKTQQILNTDVRDLFKREGRLVDEAFLAELRAILIRTDMGPSAAGAIVEEIHKQFRARVVHLDDILDVIKSKLKE